MLEFVASWKKSSAPWSILCNFSTLSLGLLRLSAFFPRLLADKSPGLLGKMRIMKPNVLWPHRPEENYTKSSRGRHRNAVEQGFKDAYLSPEKIEEMVKGVRLPCKTKCKHLFTSVLLKDGGKRKNNGDSRDPVLSEMSIRYSFPSAARRLLSFRAVHLD